MKRVAILQSNYIPWKGYFDIISQVDLFIFHDDLQYTKNDWRNRNKIKTAQGLEWLTIPCGTSEKRLICEVELADHSWQKKHWQKIKMSYQNAPFYKDYKDFLEEVYIAKTWTNLSELNQYLIQKISRDFLGIKAVFADSRSYHLTLKKADRVRELLEKCGATHYLSGPSAKDYLNETFLAESGIQLEWMNYEGYPEYPQLFGDFVHQLSIIDLLMNTGSQAINFINHKGGANGKTNEAC